MVTVPRPYFHIQSQREVMEIAARDGLSKSVRQVLNLVMIFVDEAGRAVVSRDRLAWLSGLHPDTVKDALSTLREKGYLTYPDRARGWEFRVIIRDRPTLDDARAMQVAASDPFATL